MDREPYPAARSVSPAVLAYFARHHAGLQPEGSPPAAAAPDRHVIEAVIDAAFWASLRREEGYVPKISLAFLPPEQTTHPLVFERPLPLDPGLLTRVAPAVERPGIHLGVWREAGELTVWGIARPLPPLCFVVEVAAPGLLVIKHHTGEPSGKFVNVAVLEGDQIKMIDGQTSGLADCSSLLTSLLGLDAPANWVHSGNVLARMALSMRAHGRGGSLLVVPAASDAWRESIVAPMPYAASQPLTELAVLGRAAPAEAERRAWKESLGRAIDAVAGLTAVDGAVVMTAQLEVLGFGAKIVRRKAWPPVEQVTVTEPIQGGAGTLVHPEQLGGTRHFSAAQFAQDQRDSVALVASQDGRFTVFAWSVRQNMVQAHRIEALLL
ncbi:MAG TPA: hypothetical protein VGF16_18085 [Bryobacteraceae bacterium]|jgi:hypothetical protein